MTPRKPYSTDLTDAQWQRIEGFFCVRPKGQSGRPREYSYREIVNAILYLVRTGCQWRLLPHEFPPYTLVSSYFHQWRKDGTLERIHDHLRGQVRKHAKLPEEPATLRIDSQSVKTTQKGAVPPLRKVSAMMPESTSKDANAFSVSTASA